MRHGRCLVLTLLILAVVGCRTVPIKDDRKRSFALSPSENSGVIRITSFRIPKEESFGTAFLVFAATGSADYQYPVPASVFDITDETRYIGTLGVYSKGWLEVEAVPGRHVLMLTLGGGKAGVVGDALGYVHSDFIEVDVRPGKATYIALSRYGVARFPYLGEIVISDKHVDHCLALTGTWSERFQSVKEFVTDQGINRYARDFESFCNLLSEPKRITQPNAETHERFLREQARVESIRQSSYREWKENADKREPYDLMRVYEPVTTEGLW